MTEDSFNSTIVATHCNYRLDAPFCATAKFNSDDFKEGNISIPGGWAMGAGGPGKIGNTFTKCISAPNLGAEQLVTLTVYGTKKNPVRLLSSGMGTPP
ncbi:MAG TPA: hypothetical protein VFF64_05955 [Candidatus Eremiobacteraceae bacterium]|nr:hypothetical protein [Candidatus Eremiobacteraceae bacterium]